MCFMASVLNHGPHVSLSVEFTCHGGRLRQRRASLRAPCPLARPAWRTSKTEPPILDSDSPVVWIIEPEGPRADLLFGSAQGSGLLSLKGTVGA